MERLADENYYREEFTRFYVNMACHLNWVAREAAKGKAGADKPAPLAASRFVGQGYRIDILCRKRGIRPLLALMTEPWKRSVYLGRLTKDGAPHIFAYGLKVFFGQLHEEGVYELFSRDLEQALDMHLLGGARQTCASCAKSGEDCREKPQTTVH